MTTRFIFITSKAVIPALCGDLEQRSMWPEIPAFRYATAGMTK